MSRTAVDYAAYAADDARKKAQHQRVLRQVKALESEILGLKSEIQKIQDSCTHYLSGYLGNGWHQCSACGKQF